MTNENNSNRSSLSEDQILRLGEQAATALKNPIFGTLYQILESTYLKEWRELPPDHTKNMQFLKAKYEALNDMYTTMINLTDHAERIYLERSAQNSPEAKEQRRLDEQGFGLNFPDSGAVQ